jgi:hypothetical protein
MADYCFFVTKDLKKGRPPMKSFVFALVLGIILFSSVGAQTLINPEWAFRWYWSADESDQGDVIAFDQSGNSYVAGHTDTSASSDDWVLVKVGPTGDSIWSRIYDSPSDGIDIPEYIGVDDSGYIYVCGDVGKSSVAWKTNPAVVKYDSNGNVVWTYSYNGPSSLDDRVEGFGIDDNGNIFVVGYTQIATGSPGQEDYLLIKLLPSGDTAWVRTMPTGNQTFDRLYDIAFDNSSNIYVVGGYTNVDNYDIATIKYNQSGDTLWMRLYDRDGADSSDTPVGVALDNSGNVYVGGATKRVSTDFLTVKYDSNGNFAWDYVYDGAGAGTDNPRDMVADQNGNAYLIGETTQGGQKDMLVTQVNSAGALAWVFQYDAGLNMDEIVFNSKSLLKLDSHDCLHFGGATYIATGRTETLTFKLSPDGEILWYNRYTGPGNEFNQIRSVNVDPAGNGYVTGYSDGAFGNWDLFLLKFTAQSSYFLTPFDLVFPLDNDTIQTCYPDCRWTTSTDPDSGFAVSYQVYISNTPDFANPIVSDTLSDTTWATPPCLPYDLTYYWKVIAFNGHAPNRTSGQIYSFFVEDTTTVSGCVYVPGDINGNGSANGIDVTYGVAFFKGGNVPPLDCGSPVGPCQQASPFYAAGDVNGNCAFNGIDITFYVAYLKGLQPALRNCDTCPPAGLAASKSGAMMLDSTNSKMVGE